MRIAFPPAGHQQVPNTRFTASKSLKKTLEDGRVVLASEVLEFSPRTIQSGAAASATASATATATATLESPGWQTHRGMRRPLVARFAQQVARGALRPDAGQERAAGSLEELRQKILSHTVHVGEYQAALAAWGDQVASLREQQRLAEARERERIANLPFYQQPWFTQPQWLLRLRDMQAAPSAAGPSPGSGASCSSGGCAGGQGSCAAPATPEAAAAGLSEVELQHPFWRTGLGSRAKLRAGELPTAAPAAGSAAGPASAEEVVEEEEELPPGAPPPPERPPQPSGLFLHGTVGAGKTMLMDWFAEAMAEDVRPGSPAVPPSVRCSVRRVHYNAFMIECHARLHHHTAARRELEQAAAAGREGRGEGRGGRWSVMGELVCGCSRQRQGCAYAVITPLY